MQKICLIILSLIAVPMANAAIVQHLTFDADGTASVGMDTILGTAASIDTADRKAGAGSLALSAAPSTDTAGADGAVTSGNFEWSAGDVRSVAFWMKAAAGDKGDTNATMISLGSGNGGGNRFDIRLTGDALRIEIQGSGYTTSQIIADSTWHHIAVVVPNEESTLGDVGDYIDGTFVETCGTSTLAVATGTGPLRVGDSYQDTSRDFKGHIDDVQMYDEPLDAVAIAFLYAHPGNPYQDDDLDPVVEAGLNYITWLGNGTVPLAGIVDDNGEGDIVNADVAWSIDTAPADSAAELIKTSSDWANPTADFTPDSAFDGDYTIRLTATDTSGQFAADTLVVQVAANACEAAQLDPEWTGFSIYDINENCIIDLPDIAAFAAKWMDDSSLAAPLAY